MGAESFRFPPVNDLEKIRIDGEGSKTRTKMMEVFETNECDVRQGPASLFLEFSLEDLQKGFIGLAPPAREEVIASRIADD